MKTRKVNLLIPFITASIALFNMATVQAEETACNGTLGRVEVDNLVVPDNATCNLSRTRIHGTLKVQSNAKLTARQILVVGNVQSENSDQVNILDRSRIGGSVQIKQGGGATVADSYVDGDIQLDSNAGILKVLRDDVGGSVQVVKNSSAIEIRNNVIEGNLQCKENKRNPSGGRNIVDGNKEDQCRKL